MPIEDLNFSINANIREAMDDLRDLGKQLDNVFLTVDKIDSAFRRMGAEMGLPAAQIDLLTTRIQPLVNSLAKADKQAAALQESFARKLMQQALIEHHKKIVQLADGTQRARFEMIRLADASHSIRTPTTPTGGGASSGGVNFVRVAATAGQLAVLSKVALTVQSVGRTISNVGKSATISASSMDRFRLGLSAMKVDPSLNVMKNVIDSAGNAAARFVEKTRGMADATITGIPATIGAIGNALGAIVGSGDNATATLSKFVSQIQSNQKGLQLLADVYPFAADGIGVLQSALGKIAPVAESVANRFDTLKAQTAATSNAFRAANYVLTGTFEKTGTSADLFSRATFHALLPLRLMKREAEGANRIIRASAHVWNFLTHPIHAASLAIGNSRAQWQSLRAQLPPLTGGLQAATRAQRLFSQTTYITTTTARLLYGAVSGLIRPVGAAAKGLASLLSPLRAVRPAASAAAASLQKVATAASQTASAGISSIAAKIPTITTGFAAMAAGAVAWGAKTAIATEKNSAVFGTMLHDMDQGRAAVKSLQGTQAAKFFDNQELLDSGRLLFKAGVAATDLAGKTDQFAKIAAATSTELGDLTRIYQQGANSGSFGQDKINQLAERGIAIYDGLKAATGKSGAELQSMISGGKIGVAEMDAALLHLTDGHGIYADSLKNMANTTAGKFAIMKNTITQSLGAMMGIVLDILSPFGTMLVQMTESGTAAFESFRPQIMYAATAAAWFFGNFVELGKFAFTSFSLFMVSGFNDFVYFFTDTVPAYLSWFSENWAQVFLDAGNLIFTVFSNIAKNIGSAMEAIWNYIKSGGTQDLQFAFVPLLDGFKATVSELPNIPDRAMTQLEMQLTAQTEQMAVGLGNSFDKMLAETAAKSAQATELKNTTAAAAATGPDTGGAAEKTSRATVENKAALVRSAEGLSVVAQLSKTMGGGDDKKKQTKALTTAADKLTSIEREVRNGPKLVRRAFA